MDKSAKLKNIILSKYKSIREFSNIVGIPNSTLVSALDNGIGGMAVSKVIQICEVLNIDVKTFEPLELINNTISHQEHTHIKKYRLLNEDGQHKIDNDLDDMLELPKYRAASKEEFSAPLAPDLDIPLKSPAEMSAAIAEAKQEIEQTRYARIAAHGGKGMLQKVKNQKE